MCLGEQVSAPPELVENQEQVFSCLMSLYSTKARDTYDALFDGENSSHVIQLKHHFTHYLVNNLIDVVLSKMHDLNEHTLSYTETLCVKDYYGIG